MEQCANCGKAVSYPEKGLNKKLIGASVEKFLCLRCLSEYYHVSAEKLEEKIRYYQATGCPYF